MTLRRCCHHMALCCPECMAYQRPTKGHATEAHYKLYLISNIWIGKAPGGTSETISWKFHPAHQELRGIHPKTKGNVRESPVSELQCDFIIHQSTARGHATGIVQHILVEIEDLIRHVLMVYTACWMEHSMNRLMV
jgi:hypothetical protein